MVAPIIHIFRQVLRSQWRDFVTSDMDAFLESQTSITSRNKKSSISPASPRTNDDDVTPSVDVSKAIEDTVEQSHQIERPRSRMQEYHAGIYEERMFWALQLAQHVSHLSESMHTFP
jgi:hypothetical protein